jgi:DNA-binding transcriptional regulator of glucitol operon
MSTRTLILQTIGVLVPIVAALMLRTDRRIVRQLQDAGATSPQRAQQIRVRSPFAPMRLRRLSGAGAVVETAPGYYYLAADEWQAFRALRRKRALVVLAIAVPAVLLLAWWQG